MKLALKLTLRLSHFLSVTRQPLHPGLLFRGSQVLLSLVQRRLATREEIVRAWKGVTTGILMACIILLTVLGAHALLRSKGSRPRGAAAEDMVELENLHLDAQARLPPTTFADLRYRHHRHQFVLEPDQGLPSGHPHQVTKAPTLRITHEVGGEDAAVLEVAAPEEVPKAAGVSEGGRGSDDKVKTKKNKSA